MAEQGPVLSGKRDAAEEHRDREQGRRGAPSATAQSPPRRGAPEPLGCDRHARSILPSGFVSLLGAAGDLRESLGMSTQIVLPPRVWPIDRLTAGFFLLVAAATVYGFSRIEGAAGFLLVDLAVLGSAAILVLRTPRMTPRAAALWRLGHGCVAVPLVFTQTGFLVKGIRGAEYAPVLERLDRLLCFGNPLEALERWSTPWLTEFMQWAYTAYLFLPPATVVLLALRATPERVSRSCFALLGVMYWSYLGYFLVPASGPNLHNNFGPIASVADAYPYPLLPELYTFQTDLPGVWLARELRAWMFGLEATKQDCFPSGHTAVAVVCWLLVRPLGRRLGFWFGFLAAAITVSTVYLRYHYVVDVAAGVILAWFAAGPFLKLHDRWCAPARPNGLGS
jgi:membrane-associated phospholipid phosphatase